MARITVDIQDRALRITLETMLKHDGHHLSDETPDVLIADTPAKAMERANEVPTLVLATASVIPDAINAMRRGVYGYIFVPLQPGEASLMVTRAAGAPHRVRPVPEEPDSLALTERRHILNVLRQCKGNQARAARRLGIGRNTLWRKLKTFSTDKNAP